MILIGSEAGQIYKLCNSKKDIDFLIDPNKQNLFKIYQFLQHYFDYNDFKNVMLLDNIRLKTNEKKYIELLKNPDLLSYKDIVKNTTKHTYFGQTIPVISEYDYIRYVKRGVEKFKNNYHSLKFKQILTNYEIKHR
jgi:hypothetical protein